MRYGERMNVYGIFCWIGLGLVLSGCGRAREWVHPVEGVTGAPTRVVWLQDAWGHGDVFSDEGQVRLMSLDSRDVRGERVRVEGPARLRKPLLGPRGEWIVFTRGDDGGVWALEWEGEEPRRLTEGLALAVEEFGGEVWVLVGREPVDANWNAVGRVVRVKLADPSVEVPVWDAAPVGRDNFQLGAGGRFAGGLFPWPKAGVADLGAGTWLETGRGCWTGMAPVEERLMWILDGSHRNLTMVHVDSGERWQVPLARHEAIGGHEIYHPRWSSHPRVMVMTGPYTVRKGGNNIRGGGAGVEIHVGRFAEDWRSVEAWVQVTENGHADFFPDVWVAGSAGAGPGVAGTEREPEAGGEGEVLRLRVRRVEVTRTPSLAEIAPYTQALAAHTYEVLEGPEGFEEERVLIAHWVIRDGERVAERDAEPGEEVTLRVRGYDTVPALEGERLVIEGSDLLLPIYVEAEP